MPFDSTNLDTNDVYTQRIREARLQMRALLQEELRLLKTARNNMRRKANWVKHQWVEHRRSFWGTTEAFCCAGHIANADGCDVASLSLSGNLDRVKWTMSHAGRALIKRLGGFEAIIRMNDFSEHDFVLAWVDWHIMALEYAIAELQ